MVATKTPKPKQAALSRVDKAGVVAPGASSEVFAFNYAALDASGKTLRGTAKATRRDDVVNELVRQGLSPIKVSGGPGSGFSGEIQVRKVAKHRSLVIVTRMLATMFEAGLDPLESLDVVIDDSEDLVLRNALVEVRYRVRDGEPLSDAMETQAAFPPTIVNFVRAGEASGELRQAFARIAEQYDAEDKLRAKVKKAMMYPVTVLVISSIIFAFMMLYLVPQFAATFKDLGGPSAQLPWLTRQVVTASDVLKILLPVLAVLGVPGYLVYRANRTRPKVKAFVDTAKLRLPIFGNLFHKIALARFCRNLGGLLNAGVERLEALEITARTVGSVPMENATMEARTSQRRGTSLAEPMRASPLFPNMVTKMVDVGERTAKTGEMLNRAGDIYDREVDQITDNMAALIEPIFLVVMGGMVCVIVIAIYLPYLAIGNMI